MEYQKNINLLKHSPNKSSKFRARNWNEINNGRRRVTPIVKSNLRHYLKEEFM